VRKVPVKRTLPPTSLERVRVAAVVDGVDPTRNLRLRRVQGRQAPLEHLPQCYHNGIKPLFEQSVPPYRHAVVCFRGQPSAPAVRRGRGRLLGDGGDVEWPTLEPRRQLGVMLEPRRALVSTLGVVLPSSASYLPPVPRPLRPPALPSLVRRLFSVPAVFRTAHAAHDPVGATRVVNPPLNPLYSLIIIINVINSAKYYMICIFKTIRLANYTF
jgi:hypothetical protein